jgi:hypothetical protein
LIVEQRLKVEFSASCTVNTGMKNLGLRRTGIMEFVDRDKYEKRRDGGDSRSIEKRLEIGVHWRRATSGVAH